MKWLVLICLVMVVGYGVYVWRSIQRSIDISEEFISDAVAYEQHPATPSMRILVAGDSTAVGVGGTPQESIAGRIGAANPDADIVNLGVSGARLADIIPVLEKEDGKMYDLTILQIGANDVTGRTSNADVEAQLAQALAHAHAISRRIIVLTSGDVGLSPVFKWPLSTYLSARTRAVREIFMRETAKHPSVTYVDLYQDKEDDVFLTDVQRYYAPDLFHPSGEGYGVWFSRFPKQ